MSSQLTFNHMSLAPHQSSSAAGSAPSPPERGTESTQGPGATDTALTPPQGRRFFPLGVRGLGLAAAGPQPQPG